MTTIHANGRDLDTDVLVSQIGRMNVFAISGGRVQYTDAYVVLPVGRGYSVEIELEADDTYTVRRVFTRAGKRAVKGEQTEVYNTEVGEIAYRASCFVNGPFPS